VAFFAGWLRDTLNLGGGGALSPSGSGGADASPPSLATSMFWAMVVAATIVGCVLLCHFKFKSNLCCCRRRRRAPSVYYLNLSASPYCISHCLGRSVWDLMFNDVVMMIPTAGTRWYPLRSILLVDKRLKLWLSGSARKSQKTVSRHAEVQISGRCGSNPQPFYPAAQRNRATNPDLNPSLGALYTMLNGAGRRRRDAALPADPVPLRHGPRAMVRKRHFLRCHLCIKMLILPRQARDKHRES
jgi:hypothetical protein